MKKLSKIILVVVMTFSFGFIKNVSADEIKIEKVIHEGEMPVESKFMHNVGLTDVFPFYNEGIITYGTSKPSSSSVWNLNTQGKRDIEGESNGSTLYSNYNFTGVSKMNIWVTWAQWYDVEIQLMKYRTILSDPQVGSTMVHDTDANYPNRVSQFIITGLDPNSKYYLKIKGPVYFTGYVEKAS